MNSTMRGSGALILIIGVAAVLGVGMVIKNEKGVPYTKEVYDVAHYYVVGRGEEAVLKAQEAKKKMQQHESEVQKELEK